MKKILLKLLVIMLCTTMLTGIFPHEALAVSAEEGGDPRYSDIAARGVWHRPNSSGRETTLEGLCSVLDEMKSAGINMVFLETFYHGMTVFKTNLVPYYSGFEKFDYGEYPDYLTAFATEAEKRGIEVHAWVESFYLGVNQNASLIRFHPDWMLINESGLINHTTEGAELGGYLFYDPANPAARDYILRFYDELLTKVPAVKGLNLDYIRYPVSDFYSGTDTGYTDASMSGFAEKYGLTVGKGIADFKTQIREGSLVDEWIKYRADQVTTFVGQVSEMVNEKHRDAIISVAIHPDISSAYNQKKQDFLTWIENGYIDVVTPMVYYYGASQISSALREMLARFQGVYCYSGLYTTYHNQSVDELEAHIGASYSSGADGFVLFESVKTFFNTSFDYKGFLKNKYSGDTKLYALPHWSTDRLIRASMDVIADRLTQNGESESAVTSLLGELERTSQIGESTEEALQNTIDELSALRSGLSYTLTEDSVTAAEDILSRLLDYLGLRQSRLSSKGYEDDGQTDDTDQPSDDEDAGDTEDGTPSDDEGTGDNEDGEEPTENNAEKNGFIEFFRNLFEKIINWFKKIFNIQGER